VILEIKKARRASYLSYTAPSAHTSQSERIVNGQRILQGYNDEFLGSARDGCGEEYYVTRHFISTDPLCLLKSLKYDLVDYVRLCARTLSAAHARASGAAGAILEISRKDRIADAMLSFAKAYADQNEFDYAELLRARDQGVNLVMLDDRSSRGPLRRGKAQPSQPGAAKGTL
jgi:hypothetical protein